MLIYCGLHLKQSIDFIVYRNGMNWMYVSIRGLERALSNCSSSCRVYNLRIRRRDHTLHVLTRDVARRIENGNDRSIAVPLAIDELEFEKFSR